MKVLLMSRGAAAGIGQPIRDYCGGSKLFGKANLSQNFWSKS